MHSSYASLPEFESTSPMRRPIIARTNHVHMDDEGEMKWRAREAISALTDCATTEVRSPEWLVECRPEPVTHRSCVSRSFAVYESLTRCSLDHLSKRSTASGVEV